MASYINAQADFGVMADGNTDNTIALANALLAADNHGVRIELPGGRIKITDSLLAGIGDGGSNWSPRQAVKFSGQGAGFGVYGNPVPTIIDYYGTSTKFVFDFRGRICDVELSGMFIDCHGVGNGVYAQAMTGGRISNVKISNPAVVGIGLIGGTTIGGNYNTQNIYENIHVDLMSPSSVGLLMDGNGFGTVNNDNWLSQFHNMRIQTEAGATNAICANFRFTDSCSFYRCHFDSRNEPTSTGLVLDATANDGFPCGNAFYDCSIYNHKVIEDANHHIRKNYFYGFGTYDEEQVPTHPMLVGTTDTGLWFGPIGYVAGSGGIVTQAGSKSASVTLNKLSGQITTANSPISAGGYVTFLLYNSYLTSADLLLLNITAGNGNYGAYQVYQSDIQSGVAAVSIKNNAGIAFSDSLVIAFNVFKGTAL